MRAYLQLLRLPNVFTAMADVAMGFLLTHPTLEPWPQFATLLICSSALYMAGMVLNDLFDTQLDARERPHRPIPSGRISRPTAALLGFGLLTAGVLAGGIAAILAGQSRPAIVATTLAGLVFLYDHRLKATMLAPLGMGGCRVLNVLLGMSAVNVPWDQAHLLVAAGIGLYIAGVTWFARTEAHVSHRGELIASTLVMWAGIALLAWYPSWWPEIKTRGFFDPERWYPFWLMLGGLIGLRCLRAVINPRPESVQLVVKTCLLSLIVIDAAMVFAARGPFWAGIVLVLLAPAMLLGRWIYST